jgi:ribosomal protein L31E
MVFNERGNMKIKLASNGQIINPSLRVAQRYIRLGRASIYEEPIKKVIAEKPKSKKVKKAEEVINAEIELDGIEEISIKPKVKIKKLEEESIESKTAQEETITENGY